MQGDSIMLCVTNTCATTENKIVASVVNSTELALTVGTANGYNTSSFAIYKALSKHTITIVPRSTVTNGKFIITMPGDGGGASNGIPGASGFDFNGMATGTNITLSPGTAGTVATSSPASNVVITVPFTGTLASGTAQTIVIGVNTQLLSPTKTAAPGTADTMTVQVDETDNGGNIIDTTQTKVATIESVTVSANVVPSLNFTINSTTTGITLGAITTTSASTATTVPFGNLTVGTAAYVAQYLHIDTNSNSGYIITTQSDGYLRKTNGTYVPDFNLTSSDNNGNNGFGYGLLTKSGSPTFPNQFNSGGTFVSQGFNSTTPFQIMSNSAPATGDEGWVMYRVRVTATQAQGSYQNIVTYIATAAY
jgi:hypothetical protein